MRSWKLVYVTWMVSSHVNGKFDTNMVFHPQISQMSMVLVYTSKIVNPIRQMPYLLDLNANVIQIMGGHFYIDIITPYVVLTIDGSLWYLRPMVILTRCVISIFLVQ